MSSTSSVAASQGTVEEPILLAVDEEEEQTAEEESPTVHLGSCNVVIKGIRYYKGKAHPGEYVRLVREPHNMYDRNAIRVDNLRNEKVGHVSKEAAAILAPIIDMTSTRLDGTIPRAGNVYTLPLEIDFFGEDPAFAVQLEKSLRRGGIRLVSSLTSSSPRSALTMPDVQRTTLNWKQQHQQLNDMFEKQSKDQLDNLPELPPLPLNPETKLFDHQQLGIRWMMKRENPSTEIPFYKLIKENNKNVYFCEITNSTQVQAPLPVQGGILAGTTDALLSTSKALMFASPTPIASSFHLFMMYR